MKNIQDNFSTGASDYAAFRPQSPEAVFDFIYSNTRNFDTAWDCGTGNGQVASILSERFHTVYGTDISTSQLSHAAQKENIIYRTERAEATSLADSSVDLITVAQAIHWFDFDSFYMEVRRVARPGAFFAAWTYNLLKLTPAVNEVIDDFYHGTTRGYWDKERDLVDEGYGTIPFPFQEVKAPSISIVKHWNIDQVAGYLKTWSGVQHYIRKEGKDPIPDLIPQLQKVWGSEPLLEVRWPVFVRAGFVS